MPKVQRHVRPAPREPHLWLLAVSGIGLVLSAYLTWTRMAHAPIYCPLGSGCDIVQSSRYAAVFGIPVALLGVLFYGGLFFLAGRRMEAGHRLSLALPVAFAGVGSSIVFIVTQQTAIRATCSLCLASAALTLAILVVLLARRPVVPPGLWAGSAGALAFAALFLLWGYASSAPPTPAATYAEELARHLSDTGAKLYGAYWCPHCTDQKQIFGKAADQLPYIECDGRSPAGRPAVCAAAGIRAFPTWDIAGQRYEGVLSLDDLARLSGYTAPP